MGEEECSEIDSEWTATGIFEWCEVGEAIARAKLGNPSGLDGMNTEKLRTMWKAAPRGEEAVFHACLSGGCFTTA